MRNLKTQTTNTINKLCQKYVFDDVNTTLSKNTLNVTRV